MRDWRPPTWAFIIFNIVMVGLVLLVLSSAFDPASSCEHVQGDRTACALGAGYGRAFTLIFGLGAIVITWPIGLVAIGVAWLKGRRRGR